jgi:hypothetical protein
VQTPSCWKSCGFFDTVRHQFEKEAVYSTKHETYSFRSGAKTIDPSVKIDGDTYPVKSTARRGLKQIELRFGGKSLHAVEGRQQKENAMNRCLVLFVPIVPGGRLQRRETVGLI